MNPSVRKENIQEILMAFASGNLRDNARRLFNVLGYRSEKRIDLSLNTAETFLEEFDREKKLNKESVLLDHWRSVDLLFQLTKDEIDQIASHGQVDRTDYLSYLFFSIELGDDKYTRTQLAGVTREVNKLFPMPVMLLFQHGGCLTLAIIDRRPDKRDDTRDVLKKVTFIKDIRFASPHHGHIEILRDLSFDALYDRHAFTSFVALHAAWQKTLDTSVLNKQFYQELANWYFWALDHVTFPKGARKDRDERDSISLIRMVTRLIFCWFLKEKGLIPADLFHEQKVRALLVSLKEENTYYTAILQNLFFARLNTEMDQPGPAATAKKRRYANATKSSARNWRNSSSPVNPFPAPKPSWWPTGTLTTLTAPRLSLIPNGCSASLHAASSARPARGEAISASSTKPAAKWSWFPLSLSLASTSSLAIRLTSAKRNSRR